MRKSYFWREAGGWPIVLPLFINHKKPAILQQGTKGELQVTVTPLCLVPPPPRLQVWGANPPSAYGATALNGGGRGARPVEQEGEEKGKWLWAGAGVESCPTSQCPQAPRLWAPWLISPAQGTDGGQAWPLAQASL